MIRQRVRIRFRKEGDLRLISHRDLVRTFERLFRRAQLQLSMSEGYHPKARVSYPSALALGIDGLNEVMEFELAEHIPAADLLKRLSRQTPPGLTVFDVRLLEPGEGKAHICRATYAIPVPESLHECLAERICQFTEQSSYLVRRDGRDEPVDLKAGVDHLDFCDGVLQFRLHMDRQCNVRPREMLEALELADLENDGFYLTRTELELAP